MLNDSVESGLQRDLDSVCSQPDSPGLDEWEGDRVACSNGSNPNSDWDQGYGYQFWRCRHGAYRGDGAFGQYCIVLPEQDAVIAITSGVKDMQSVLNLVVTLVARFDGVERRLVCGRGAWQKSRLAWGALPEQPLAASGAWTADDTFTAKICFYETPFIITVRLTFSGDEVLHCNSEANVGFGPTKEPELVGKAR